MAIWAELRKRRVFGFLGAYIAAGFLVLEGVDQLVGHNILPELAYPLVLVFYLFGIPGATIIAWFHGEKGPQRPPAIEIWLQAGLLVAALAVCWNVYGNSQSGPSATDVGLDPRRIAVLYFEDLSAAGELGYLADGLTEALIDQLAQVRALDVVSRNGVTPFRGSDIPRDSIARMLEAGSLIEGSVEQVRGGVRVTTRLVDGVSGVDFQRASFEVPEGDYLAISGPLAEDVSEALRARLGEEIRVRLLRAATASDEAWALVQRGERLRKDASSLAWRDLAAAFANLEQADSIAALAEAADRDWVEPIVLRGRIAYERARLTEDPYEALPWVEAGVAHANRALGLAGAHAEALALRGRLRYHLWSRRITPDPDDWQALLQSARQDLEAAVTADPSLASAHVALSFLYYQVDDVPAALLAARRAYEEDAYLDDADAILSRLFWGSLDLEQFNQARRWCEEGAGRFPQDYRFRRCQLWLMATPAVPADVAQAWQLAQAVGRLAPEPQREYGRIEAEILVGGALARSGDVDSARAVLQRASAQAGHDVDPTQTLLAVQAYVLTLTGDRDEAIDLLKRYKAANPDHGFEHAAGTAWWWRELRSHPRFNEITGP